MVDFGGHQHIGKPDPGSEDGWVAYDCYGCGAAVTGAVVARPIGAGAWGTSVIRWLWCNNCGAPAVRDEKSAIRPGTRYGPAVPGLPTDVQSAYDEARDCMSVGAYTGAELLCRKILMHVAVEKGLPAKNEKKRAPRFDACVDYLADQGYVTPPMRRWVDRIRENGNEATHDLDAPSKGRAESTVTFTAQMLNNVYGMEHLASIHAPSDGEKPGA